MDKRIIRKEVLRQRDSITAEGKKTKNDCIKNNLINLPEFQKAHRILFYASYKSEVDTFGLMNYCMSVNKTIALPKVKKESSELEIYEVRDLSELGAGYQNIPEPILHKDRIMQVKDIDLIIVPGVAFDEHCNRLGYGKGFYDKMLNEKSSPAIALAYEEQIADSVPAEPHDIKMDKIITDKRVIVRNGY